MIKTLILAAAACAALTGAVSAAPAPKAAAKTALICPVTGEKIASVGAAYNHETYKGKTYYFCCPNCKPRFDKNPAKIVTAASHGKYQPM